LYPWTCLNLLWTIQDALEMRSLWLCVGEIASILTLQLSGKLSHESQ